MPAARLSTPQVRAATAQDAPAVAAVYAQGIASGAATVVAQAPSADELARRIDAADPRHCWLVAVDGEQLLGWAATMPYLPPPAYARIAEFSVYVATAAQGRGVGRLLMTELLRRSEQAGLHKLTSRVFADNLASRDLLTAVGFREVGTHLRHACVEGIWRDVVVVEVLMGAARED